MKESKFQKHIIDEVKSRFEGCVVLKNDANYIQGIPDLTILYKKKWAALEIKNDEKASHQPNQDYYISKLDSLSFARFINPQNEKEVLDALEHTFKPRR